MPTNLATIGGGSPPPTSLVNFTQLTRPLVSPMASPQPMSPHNPFRWVELWQCSAPILTPIGFTSLGSGDLMRCFIIYICRPSQWCKTSPHLCNKKVPLPQSWTQPMLTLSRLWSNYRTPCQFCAPHKDSHLLQVDTFTVSCGHPTPPAGVWSLLPSLLPTLLSFEGNTMPC